jgi:outer membrane protein assembly factor BamB
MKLDNSGIYLAGGSFMYDSTADAFLIKYSLEGDSLFSIVYSLQPNVRDEFNSLAVDANSDLYLTGVTTINNFERKMILQKYSSSGEITWSKDFNFKARGVALILDKDGQPILAYDNWEGPQYAYLVINSFNTEGDSIWSVVFRDDTSAYGIGDIIRDNENFIYAGIIQLQIINGQHIYHSYVACIKDGNLIWYRPLEGSNIRKIVLDSENNLVAFTQFDSRIYKINSATGETIWEKNVNDSLYHIPNLYDLGVDQLNNVIVTGNNSNMNAIIQIKKLSSLGEELWLQEYNSQGDFNDIPMALALDMDNNIYITGASVNSIFKSYVIKLSTAGELKWEYHLNEISYEQLYLWSIIVKDSSLFIGGSLYDFLTKSNIFIMKLDQNLSTGINEIYLKSNSYKLNQNFPNPFNPSTKISYEISQRGIVTLKVFDILGNEVAILVNKELPAGEYEVEFSATGLPSGIYFYQLKAGNFIITKKMLLLK